VQFVTEHIKQALPRFAEELHGFAVDRRLNVYLLLHGIKLQNSSIKSQTRSKRQNSNRSRGVIQDCREYLQQLAALLNQVCAFLSLSGASPVSSSRNQ